MRTVGSSWSSRLRKVVQEACEVDPDSPDSVLVSTCGNIRSVFHVVPYDTEGKLSRLLNTHGWIPSQYLVP
jgi:hypothetical protein